MSQANRQLLKDRLVKEFFADPDPLALIDKTTSLPFAVGLVAYALVAHRERPILELVEMLKSTAIPFKGFLDGMFRLYNAELWTLHPVVLAVDVGEVEVVDVDGQEEGELVLKGDRCECDDCRDRRGERKEKLTLVN